MLRNLGHIAGLLRQHANDLHTAHDDVDAFHAPSECHTDVNRAWERECIALIANIEHTTDYTARELDRELVNRCSAKFLYNSGIMEPLHFVIAYREKQEREREYRQFANHSSFVAFDERAQRRW